MPDRIQLRRTRGWRMPTGTVKVDRSGVFGNPYDHREHGKARACELFAEFLCRVDRIYLRNGVATEYPSDAHILTALRDATAVACWCPLDEECHGDVLLGHLAALTEGYDYEDGPTA